MTLFSAPALEQTHCRRAQSLLKSHKPPATGVLQRVSLVRPATGAETHPDRPFDYCLGSKSEVSALCIGTYWFPGIVNEITLGPRLASLDSNDQSRNRSAPLELSSHRVPIRLTKCPTASKATGYNGRRAAEIPQSLRHRPVERVGRMPPHRCSGSRQGRVDARLTVLPRSWNALADRLSALSVSRSWSSGSTVIRRQ